MATTAPEQDGRLDSAAEVLAFTARRRADRMRADADLLVAACAWADLHPVRPGEPGATITEAFGDTGLTVAGPGAPLVEEFAVPAFAARLGLRTEAGARLIGEALELRHRLPALWARVQSGPTQSRVEAWQARRIAHETIRRALTPGAAAFVDRHLAPVAGRVGLPTIERCIDEAIWRCTGDLDPRDPEDPVGPDARRFGIDRRQVSFEGTLECHGTLDLADALAIDDALRAEMDRLRALGAPQTAGPLSAIALTTLVCRERPLDLPTPDDLDRDDLDRDGLDTPASSLGGHSTTEGTGHSTTEGTGHSTTEDSGRSTTGDTGRQRDRTVLLHLHLSASAVTGGTGTGRAAREVGRVEETRAPVTAKLVRAWCGADATTHIRVLPVLDLDQRVHVESYEMPHRIRAQAALTALTCVFPWCERPARATSTHRGCDTDHVEPHDHHTADPPGEDQPGPTATDNAAPLCRAHHRLKTHAPARHRWHLTQLDHGMWLWRSPDDQHYLRDNTGTHPVQE